KVVFHEEWETILRLLTVGLVLESGADGEGEPFVLTRPPCRRPGRRGGRDQDRGSQKTPGDRAPKLPQGRVTETRFRAHSQEVPRGFPKRGWKPAQIASQRGFKNR